MRESAMANSRDLKYTSNDLWLMHFHVCSESSCVVLCRTALPDFACLAKGVLIFVLFWMF
jgi:hypothetical protein